MITQNIPKLIIPLTVAASLVAAAPLFSAWEVINTFNDPAEIEDWQIHNILPEGNGFIQIVDRPYDSRGGGVLAASSGNVPYSHTNIWRPLPAPVTDLTTLYMEVAIEDVMGDYAFGVKRVAPDQIVRQEGDTTVVSQWANFAALSRMGRHGQDAYDTNGYAPAFGESLIRTWYQYWWVIDHFNLSYSLYVKGGEFEEQTLAFQDYIYRVQEFDDLLTFMLIIHPGGLDALNSAEPIYFDNIFIDYTGMNLSDPTEGMVIPQTWAGFPLESDGVTVDTGDFLGVLHVGNTPWVYSYDLESWLHLPADHVGEAGAWIFLAGELEGYPATNGAEFLDTGIPLGWLYVGHAPDVYSYTLNKWMHLPQESVTETGSWSYVFR